MGLAARPRRVAGWRYGDHDHCNHGESILSNSFYLDAGYRLANPEPYTDPIRTVKIHCHDSTHVFLGHFGLAMGAKRWASELSLGVLILATQWADLLWPILVLAGVEHVAIEPGITAFNSLDFTHYPWSHSLLLGLVWGLVFGVLYFAWKRDAWDALLVGVLVSSHWLLDLVVHRPDLPLWPGGLKVGLGLWNSVVVTLIVEFGLFAAGVVLYLTATTPRDRIGAWGAYGLVLLLAVLFLGTSFGSPPVDATSVALGTLPLWIVVPVAYWIDAHRDGRGSR